MDEQQNFHLFYMYMHKHEILSQFTCIFILFFFYLLIRNELFLTKESSIIWKEAPFKMLPQNWSILFGKD
jgi:hypothetical protein